MSPLCGSSLMFFVNCLLRMIGLCLLPLILPVRNKISDSSLTLVFWPLLHSRLKNVICGYCASACLIGVLYLFANKVYANMLLMFIVEQLRQKERIHTLILLGIFFTGKLKAYKRCAWWVPMPPSRIFSQRWSAELLDGAQARMCAEGLVLIICWIASTRVTVLPEEHIKKTKPWVLTSIPKGCLIRKAHTTALYLCQVVQIASKGQVLQHQQQCGKQPFAGPRCTLNLTSWWHRCKQM